MEEFEQSYLRFKDPALAVVGGIGAALVIATLPHVYLENLVGLTGLSEIVPAAAPPLGNTARSLIAIAAGLVSASAIYFILNRKGDPDMGVALREQIIASEAEQAERDLEAEAGKSRFSMPKLAFNAKSLTRFLKKPKKKPAEKKVMDLADLPMLRDGDSHPDAPPRRPIFADSDLGTPLAAEIPQFEQAPVEEPAPVMEQVAAAMPAVETAAEEPLELQQPLAPQATPEPAVETASAAQQDLSGLSVSQLADRLEFSLRRLKQLELASRSVESVVAAKEAAEPASAPVQESVSDQPVEVADPAQPALKSVDSVPAPDRNPGQADMDAALKAALGTLERMTAQR